MEFAVFTYNVNGQQYVDAYPTNNRPLSIFDGLAWLPVCAVSRNQARKRAYQIWIDATGKGFNRFPMSPIWERFHGVKRTKE